MLTSFIKGVDNKLLGKRDWSAKGQGGSRHPNIWRDIHIGRQSTSRTQGRVNRTWPSWTVYQRTRRSRLLRGTVALAVC